jgi:hypothetical protein
MAYNTRMVGIRSDAYSGSKATFRPLAVVPTQSAEWKSQFSLWIGIGKGFRVSAYEKKKGGRQNLDKV